jgi:hypothetical protein
MRGSDLGNPLAEVSQASPSEQSTHLHPTRLHASTRRSSVAEPAEPRTSCTRRAIRR